MATKVKGDKIKEGSIPLSALADDVKDKLNNIFIMPEDFVEEEYNEPDEGGFLGKIKQVYVTDILENRYNKINVDGVLGDINISDGLINITAKSEVFQSEQKQDSYIKVFIRVQDCKFKQLAYLNKSPFVTITTDAADINGDIRYNFVKSVTDEQKTIPEENKQLFKKNMGSFANWNAQHGEAGYIENRTHYYGNTVKFKYNEYDDLYETDYVPSDEGPIYIEDVFAWGWNKKYEIPSIETSEDGQSGYDWSNALTIEFWDASEEYYGEFKVGYDIDNSKVVAIYSENEADVDYDSRIKAMNIFNVVRIESEFIPDTVVKTTPQTLSDTAKNQVKENLGISTPATPDWNAQEGEEGYIANKPNLLFEKGDAENSAVLKGGDNVAVLKGWYYSSIYKESNSIITVYLDSKQKICVVNEPLKTVAQTPDISLPNLVNILGIGTIVSLVNDAKYDNKFKIIGGGNGEVRLQTIDDSNIPFNVIKAESINDPEDYSIYCVSKPDTGMFDMGQGSIAIGYKNKATNGKSTAFGYNNHAYGKFSFVEGRDNEAGYAAHAEGRETHATGDQSHSEGRNTWATGDASHAEGSSSGAAGAYSHAEGGTTHAYGDGSHSEGLGTKANTKASHAEGDNTSATGIASHAEGVKTKTLKDAAHAEGAETSAEEWATHAEGYATRAVGYGSHTEGDHTIANNPYEHASGRFNKSETGVDSSKKTRYSIGIGTSETNRKNAFEVKQNGDIYIEGVEGRIQDKLNTSTSVTLDWEAKEGEAGYIENKPFSINHSGEILNDNFNINSFNPVEQINLYCDNFDTIQVTYNFDIMDIETEAFIKNISNTVILKHREGISSDDIYFYNDFDGSDFSGEALFINIENLKSMVSLKGYVTILINPEIKTLDSVFLPNTVIKTTPQTLSDTDKNQALANLGIDPVVWKYICKPYIFNSRDFNMQMPIPSELMQNGKLKYKIPAMYRINLTNQCTDPNSGEEIDFPEINNQYGEYTPETVTDNRITTAYLNNDYSLVINITATGTWNIQLSV